MANTLAAPADLVDFPGAPFTEKIVDSAVAALRLIAGWHIAPPVTETVTVDGGPGTVLMLPTLNLTAVTEVRDVSVSPAVVLTGWRKKRAGMLHRLAGWPQGFETVQVDMTHGYSATPPELLPVIATFCQLADTDATVAQERLGSWATTLRDSLEQADMHSDVLGRFTIPQALA